MSNNFRKPKQRLKLKDYEISGMVKITTESGFKYVISDVFKVVIDNQYYEAKSVSELLRLIRGHRQ